MQRNAPIKQRLIPILGIVAALCWYVWFMYYSDSAYITAAMRGDSHRVLALLSRGTPVDTTDSAGKSTALIHASHSPSSASCRLLLDHGANVNAKNGFGNTALILASSSGRADTVRLLLSRGADVNAVSNRGNTALRAARREGHADIVAILLAAGAK